MKIKTKNRKRFKKKKFSKSFLLLILSLFRICSFFPFPLPPPFSPLNFTIYILFFHPFLVCPGFFLFYYFTYYFYRGFSCRKVIFFFIIVYGFDGTTSLQSTLHHQMERFSGLYTGPYFDSSTPNNITTQLGTHAYLPCKVKQLGNKSVSKFIF